MSEIKLPTIRNYGDYSSNNYGAHTLEVAVPNVGRIWFSYKTIVAFDIGNSGFVIHENIWGNTTGKHLNWLDDNKSIRKSSEEFQRLYEEAIASLQSKNGN